MPYLRFGNDNDYQKQMQLITVLICRFIFLVVWVGILCSISSCTSDNTRTDKWDHYIETLGDILNQALPAENYQTTIMWHRAPKALITSSTQIDLVEFWQLKRCLLHHTVAQKNSGLGRFNTTSQELLYDLRFIDQVPACQLTIHEEHPQLSALLGEIRQEKIATLSGRIYEATLNAIEWQRFYQVSEVKPRNIQSGLLAIEQLNQMTERWLTGEYGRSHDRIESLLGRIYHSNAAGFLTEYARRELSYYRRATELLTATKHASQPLCFQPTPTRRAKRLRGLITGYFNSESQQTASLALQQWRVLNEQLDQLEHRLDEYLDQKQRDTMLKRQQISIELVAAQRAHAQLATELLSQCGLSVG